MTTTTSKPLENLTRGDQILYVPDHADGDTEHPDCEAGFVWEWTRGDNAYCRFWRKGEEGVKLLTLANSQSCWKGHLVARRSATDEQVQAAIEMIEERVMP